MKKTGKIIFFGTLFGLLCSFGNAQTVQAQDEIAIEDGVCIGNVDVGGTIIIIKGGVHDFRGCQIFSLFCRLLLQTSVRGDILSNRK